MNKGLNVISGIPSLIIKHCHCQYLIHTIGVFIKQPGNPRTLAFSIPDPYHRSFYCINNTVFRPVFINNTVFRPVFEYDFFIKSKLFPIKA